MIRPSARDRLAQPDLALAALLTLTALLVTVTEAPLVARLVMDSILVLFLPGFGLLSALVLAHGLSGLERVMISIAASITMAIGAGFALAALGLPLDRLNWVTVLSTVALALILVGWVRRWLRGVVTPLPTVPGMPLRQAAMALIAMLVFADAVLGSRLIAGAELGAPPEQLWLLRSTVDSAQLGMRAGPDGGAYVVRVSSAGLVVSEYQLSLDSSEVWQTPVALSPEQAQLPLVARLYRDEATVEMRFVVLQPAASPDGS